jgi:hypothetical protein
MLKNRKIRVLKNQSGLFVKPHDCHPEGIFFGQNVYIQYPFSLHFEKDPSRMTAWGSLALKPLFVNNWG